MRRAIQTCVLVVLLASLGCGPKEPLIDMKLKTDYSDILIMYHLSKGKTGEEPQGVGAIEFLAIEKMKPAVEAVKNGRLVVVWGAPVTRDVAKDSATILVFEKDALTRGGHVQMVDPVTVKMMSADELKAALEKSPAWKALEKKK